MKLKFDVKGLEDVDKILTKIAPNQARNLMRSTVHGYVGRIAKKAKTIVNTDTFTTKKAIKARREKSTPDKPRSSVIITRGKSARNNAWWWRFIEYGTSGKTAQAARPFIAPAAQQMESQKINIIKEEFAKKLEKTIKRQLKKAKK